MLVVSPVRARHKYLYLLKKVTKEWSVASENMREVEGKKTSRMTQILFILYEVDRATMSLEGGRAVAGGRIPDPDCPIMRP